MTGRFRRCILLVTALAAIFSLTPLRALAQAAGAAPAVSDSLAEIRASGILRVGLTGDYDPFSVADPRTGTFRGLDVDAAQMLAAAIGPDVKVQIVKTSWPTMTADLLAGKFDIAMGGVSRNKPRAVAGELSHAYLIDGKVALIRSADKARFQTLADLDRSNVTVLVNPGGTNQQFVDATVKNAKVVVVNDNLSIGRLVAEGKGDVMFTDRVEALLLAKRDPRLAVVAADKPWTRTEKVYFVPKGQTALLDAVNAWVDRMQADGSYTKLWAKWVGV